MMFWDCRSSISKGKLDAFEGEMKFHDKAAILNENIKTSAESFVVLVLGNGEVASNIPSKLVQGVIFPMVSCPSPYGSCGFDEPSWSEGLISLGRLGATRV